MKDSKKEYRTGSLMILTAIIIFCVVGIIVGGFRVIKKNEDAKLAAASDTEYTEYKQNKAEREKQEEHYKEEVTDDSQSQTDSDSEEEADVGNNQSVDKDSEFNISSTDSLIPDGDAEAEYEEDGKVYLIKGNEKSSNRYEKADHLSYTTTIKYTEQDLSLLDSYGLKITRNEIYARHGRMFNDQELQEYFQRQKWYVPQTASNDFDSSSLNEVEKYNVELIRTYEQQVGGR